MRRYYTSGLIWPRISGVRYDARDALRSLHAAIDRATLDGPLPCEVDTDLHYDDDRTAEAIAACRRCPVVEECDTFATANREVHGVWGARDREPRHRKRTNGSRSRGDVSTSGGGGVEIASQRGWETDRTAFRAQGRVSQVGSSRNAV